eukprot:2629039-Prymnesium_polylepis.1
MTTDRRLSQLADCRGNVLEPWNRRSPDRTPFAATAAGRKILTEAIERLRSYRPDALRICWGNPELVLFTMRLGCVRLNARMGLTSGRPFLQSCRGASLPAESPSP